MKNILFVCTGNTCRSPMAQEIFNKMANEKKLPLCAKSCGVATMTGLPVSDNAKSVCKEFGIDISKMRTTSVYDLDLSYFDLIFAISPSHKNALIQLGANEDNVKVLNEENGGIQDPYGGNIQIYRQCRDEIYAAIESIIKDL